METETPQQTPETPAAPPAAPETPQPIAPETQSLQEHEEQFGPPSKRVTPDRDETTGKFVKGERHRAESQKATPAEAPRIAELTKKFRTAEQERDALRAELEKLKTVSAPVQPTPQTPAPARQDAPQPQTAGWTKPEPKIEDFAREADPYAEWVLAKAEWRLEKRQFEADQKNAATKAEKDAEVEYGKLLTTYRGRETEFKKSHPDWDTVLDADHAKNLDFTPQIHAAILEDDNGPAFVYYLAQHPNEYYEMLLQTDGKPYDPKAVALLRRVLSARVQAASTGSVASQVPISQAPRPLNPVRTGPQPTGTEPPGDSGSLADHERLYGKNRNRR